MRTLLSRRDFIREKQRDAEYAGIYDTVERDGAPVDHVKARMWKDTYHDARALMNVGARLRKFAGVAPR